jgi:hypothetical protein
MISLLQPPYISGQINPARRVHRLISSHLAMKKRRSVEKLWPFIRENPRVEIKRGFKRAACIQRLREERKAAGAEKGGKEHGGAEEASDKGKEKARVS